MKGGTIGGFELVSILGTGATGVVWKARHLGTGSTAAVKLIAAKRKSQSKFHEMFRHEARAMAMLDHPHIVKVFDYGVAPVKAPSGTSGTGGSTGEGQAPQDTTNLSYIALEIASGGSLDAAMRRSLNWSDIRHILLSVLDGLAHAHARGLVHRDIKPDNVLACASDGNRKWKLTDFGIAHIVEESGTKAASITGTPLYMPPEQVTADAHLFGPWSDLYSVGCMAYEMATGSAPFCGETSMQTILMHVNADVPAMAPLVALPEGFERWVLKLLQKKPEDRFRRAADAAWALLQLQQPTSASQSQQALSLHEDPDSTLGIVLADHARETVVTEDLGWASDGDDMTSAMSVTEAREGSIGGPEFALPPIPQNWPPRPAYHSDLDGISIGLFGLKRPPLVGRDEQFKSLWTSFRTSVRDSKPRIALIAGGAGVGKTRLAEQFTERLDELGYATTVRIRGNPDEPPGRSIADGVRKFLRIDGMPVDDQRERLLELFDGEDGSDNLSDILVGAVTQLLLGTDAERADIPLQERAWLYGEILQRSIERRPLALMMDDLQWTPDAAALLQSMLDSIEAPIFACATIRPEVLAQRESMQNQIDELSAHERVSEIVLEPLSPDETNILMGRLLNLSGAMKRRLSVHVQGNPLFLIQLVGEWLSQGLVVQTSDGFEPLDDARLTLPDDLHELWSNHLARVMAGEPDDARIALELAAVIGHEVDWNLWSEGCQRLGVVADYGLVERLVQQRLAKMDQGRWRFGHAMARESLLRDARENGRLVSLHAALIEPLESRYRSGRDLALERRLAVHYFGAREFSKAIEPLKAAVRIASDRADSMVFELLDMAERVGDELGEPLLLAELTVLRARAMARTPESKEVPKILQPTIDEALSNGWSAVAAEAYLVLGLVDHLSRNFAGKLPERREAVRLAQDAGDPRLIIETATAFADHLGFVGETKRAISVYRDVIALADAQSFPYERAWALYGLGYAYQQQGKFDQASRTYSDAYNLYREHGHLTACFAILGTKGDIDRLRGDFGLAESAYLQTYHFYQKRDLVPLMAEYNLALLGLDRGDAQMTAHWLHETRKTQEERARGQLDLELYVVDLGLALLKRQFDQVEGHIDSVEKSAGKGYVVSYDFPKHLERFADTLVAESRPDEAARLYPIAAKMWRTLSFEELAQRVDDKLATI